MILRVSKHLVILAVILTVSLGVTLPSFASDLSEARRTNYVLETTWGHLKSIFRTLDKQMLFIGRGSFDIVVDLLWGPAEPEYYQRIYGDEGVLFYLPYSKYAETWYSLPLLERLIRGAPTWEEVLAAERQELQLPTEVAHQNQFPQGVYSSPITAPPPPPISPVVSEMPPTRPHSPATNELTPLEAMLVSKIESPYKNSCDLIEISVHTPQTNVILYGPLILAQGFTEEFLLAGETVVDVSLFYLCPTGPKIHRDSLRFPEEHRFTKTFDSIGTQTLTHEYVTQLGEKRVFEQEIQVFGISNRQR